MDDSIPISDIVIEDESVPISDIVDEVITEETLVTNVVEDDSVPISISDIVDIRDEEDPIP